MLVPKYVLHRIYFLDYMDVDIETIPEQESSQLKDAEPQHEKPSNSKGEGGGPLEEAKVEVNKFKFEYKLISSIIEELFEVKLLQFEVY